MKTTVLGSLCLVTCASALAQDARDPAGAPEEIVVTGSRLRGTGPVGSDVVSIGAAQIERVPTATITEYLRTVPQLQGYPVETRGRLSAGWLRNGASAELAVTYTDGYTNNLVTPAQSVDDWTTLDLHLGYDFQQEGGVLQGLRIALDATNLLDEDAPFVNIQFGFDPGQASALGRLVAISLSKSF